MNTLEPSRLNLSRCWFHVLLNLGHQQISQRAYTNWGRLLASPLFLYPPSFGDHLNRCSKIVFVSAHVDSHTTRFGRKEGRRLLCPAEVSAAAAGHLRPCVLVLHLRSPSFFLSWPELLGQPPGRFSVTPTSLSFLSTTHTHKHSLLPFFGLPNMPSPLTLDALPVELLEKVVAQLCHAQEPLPFQPQTPLIALHPLLLTCKRLRAVALPLAWQSVDSSELRPATAATLVASMTAACNAVSSQNASLHEACFHYGAAQAFVVTCAPDRLLGLTTFERAVRRFSLAVAPLEDSSKEISRSALWSSQSPKQFKGVPPQMIPQLLEALDRLAPALHSFSLHISAQALQSLGPAQVSPVASPWLHIQGELTRCPLVRQAAQDVEAQTSDLCSASGIIRGFRAKP